MPVIMMMKTTLAPRSLPRLGAAILPLMLAGAAMAAGSNTTASQKAPASSSSQQASSPRYGKVGDSIQHGTNVAGRGVANADSAARRGIDKGSEAASRPVRNLGDSLGRSLGLGPARSGPPARGPQSEAP